MRPSELELALGIGPAGMSLPPELPLAHLTAARWLREILGAGQLLPRLCKVFNQQLLYFSYGGVFYRTSNLNSQNVAELPVAMVFRPEILDCCARLFPFDSGAMAGKLFGDDWFAAMKPFETRFSVSNGNLSDAARRIVHNVYRTNSKYVEGKPAKIVSSTEPILALLHQFLSQDLSSSPTVPTGIDHRQRSIELVSEAGVSIASNLVWIGLPLSRFSKTMKTLRKLTRTVPEVYTYRFTKNFNPNEYAAMLQQAARNQVIERYLK